jgi:hypothetical protein
MTASVNKFGRHTSAGPAGAVQPAHCQGQCAQSRAARSCLSYDTVSVGRRLFPCLADNILYHFDDGEEGVR